MQLIISHIFCLVKGHALAQKRENEEEIGSKIQELKFGDLKDEPLGSAPSILFWNDQQRQIYTRVTSMQHTLLVGDYGTGFNIIGMSFYRITIIRQDPDPGGRGQGAVREGEH